MVPEVSTGQDLRQIIRETGFNRELGLQTSTKLTFMTEGGDRVRFSLDDQFRFSRLGQEPRFAHGSQPFKFSLSAQVASELSLRVEGDLNEKEIAVIRTLTQALTPIAQSFFTEDGFDLERVQEALSGRSGVIQEVEMNLEKSVQASVSAHKFFQGSVDDLETLAENFLAPGLPAGAQDLNGLVQSVVDSVFRPLEVEFPEDSLIQTFTEFKNFLIDQVVKIFNLELPPKSKAVVEGESENTSDQIKEPAPSSEVEEMVFQPETKSFAPITI